MTRPARALLSAHRGAASESGVPDNSLAAIKAACALDVEYVEFDVHRTLDDEYVLTHDAHVPLDGRPVAVKDLTARALEDALGRDLVRYDHALSLIAAAGKKAHIDFKFVSPALRYYRPETTHEVEAARIARDIMGDPGDFIITSFEDESIDVLAAWADRFSPGTRVGLSLGRDVMRRNPAAEAWVRSSELFPGRRIRRSGANLVVVNYRLASMTVLAWAHRHGLPVLVWTVDSPAALRRYLSDPRVWMVTSNYPSRALGLPRDVPAAASAAPMAA